MLGAEPASAPDLRLFDAEIGDLYVVCSDGVWNFVAEGMLERILASEVDVERIASAMIDAAANPDGSYGDDASVVIVSAQDRHG